MPIGMRWSDTASSLGRFGRVESQRCAADVSALIATPCNRSHCFPLWSSPSTHYYMTRMNECSLNVEIDFVHLIVNGRFVLNIAAHPTSPLPPGLEMRYYDGAKQTRTMDCESGQLRVSTLSLAWMAFLPMSTP